MKMKKSDWFAASESLLDYIDASPTPFHAVRELEKSLTDKGFSKLDEQGAWEVQPEGRYFVSRNQTSLVAFTAGTAPLDAAGFKIIGAHTDSPNLRLKPNPLYRKNGYLQLGVEVYGGALLTTWTDRDLSLAGRVVLRSGKGIRTQLVDFARPLCRIPQLAIHLNREVNEKGLVLNRQNHLPPILSMDGAGPLKSDTDLKKLVAKEIKCRVGDILGLELHLHDTQKSTLAGPEGEFIFAPRLDNLASCHAGLCALADNAGIKDPLSRVLAFYDNEEVGSESAEGGASPFLKDVLERLLQKSAEPREALMRALARSLFVSADMAHAVHPNYSEKHDARHLPVLNGGPVIKSHAGKRYATDGISSAHFELLCEQAKVPVQRFAIRSDMFCGSTIGPITATNLGIRTVDIGSPMLSMHSIREMAGSKDHARLIRVFKKFFQP